MEVVEAVKRTEKWLRRLYEERRTMWRLFVEAVKRTEKWLRRLSGMRGQKRVAQ